MKERNKRRGYESGRMERRIEFSLTLTGFSLHPIRKFQLSAWTVIGSLTFALYPPITVRIRQMSREIVMEMTLNIHPTEAYLTLHYTVARFSFKISD